MGCSAGMSTNSPVHVPPHSFTATIGRTSLLKLGLEKEENEGGARVRQQRILQGISVTVLGLALALVPMTGASASHKKHHKPAKHHHTTKTVSKTGSKTGSNPGATLCGDIASTDNKSSDLGVSLEKAMEGLGTGGSFASVKQAMLAAFTPVLQEEGPAESALSGAPANVQAALKGLFAFESSFKTAVSNASSLTQLEQSLETLGTNPTLKTDSLTLANYVTSVCGTKTSTT